MALSTALRKVVKDMSEAEDVASAVIEDAIRDAIDGIATKYGLDSAMLYREFGADAVTKHSAFAEDGTSAKEGVKFCQGVCANGKKCTHSVKIGNYCRKHARRGKEVDDKRRNLRSYMTTLSEANKENIPPPNGGGTAMMFLSQPQPAWNSTQDLMDMMG